MQVSARDAQLSGGQALVPAAFGNGLAYQINFELPQEVLKAAWLNLCDLILLVDLLNVFREIDGGDAVSVSDDNGSLHDVFKFSNVPRPRIPYQRGHGAW